MIMVDTERLHTAQLLYNLRDRLDAELALRKHPSTRANVKHAISVIEATADQTMRGLVDLDTADAIAEAGELTLRQLIGIRKLRDNMNHEPNRIPPDLG